MTRAAHGRRRKARPTRASKRKAGLMAVSIHPSVDGGVKKGNPNFAGGTLTCKCAQMPVTVSIGANVAFNHACGCTKCWKPKGALFSVFAVVAREKLEGPANSQKLKIVDSRATMQGYVCSGCC